MTTSDGKRDEAGQPSDLAASNAGRAGAGAAAFRGVIWWLLLIAAIATIVAAIFFWVYVFVPAIVMIVLYGLLLVTNLVARRTPVQTTPASAAPDAKPEFAEAKTAAAGHSDGPPPAEEPDEQQRWRELERVREQQEDRRTAEEKASLKIALPIAGGLLVVAVILASVIFHWRIAAIGGLVIFCYMLLVGGPFWLLTIDESKGPEKEQRVGPKA